MAVNLTNSNALPMTLQGVSVQSPVPPATVLSSVGLVRGQTPSTIAAPTQILGLVPVFSCCQNKAYLYWVNTIGVNVVTFHVVINGHDYGVFSTTGTDSANTNLIAFSALLPSGLSAVISFIPLASIKTWTITIYANDTIWNDATLQLTNITGTATYGSSNFTNGNITDCDCREGKYHGDSISNDHDFPLQVYADPTAISDSYTADTNTWWFNYPGTYNAITSGNFKLQEYLGGTWTTIATLNGSTYGTPFKSSCTNLNISGFTIDWTKVYNAFGAGKFRFNVSGQVSKSYAYCFNSPPFCLDLFDCLKADRTIKFNVQYAGGTFGSVSTQGINWSLCCGSSKGNGTIFNAISMTDSIRISGKFGYKTYDHEKNYIKYQPGTITKIRDEIIKKFKLELAGNPDWLIDRLVAYAFADSDKVFVSDYNLNNSDYSVKKLWIVPDSGFVPKYNNSSRYNWMHDTAFKEGQQSVYRSRCC